MKKLWPWALGAALSLAFPLVSRTFHYPNPLAWLAYPNIITALIVCPNVHAGCGGAREVVATALAFLLPALVYGVIFAIVAKLAGLMRRKSRV